MINFITIYIIGDYLEAKRGGLAFPTKTSSGPSGLRRSSRGEQSSGRLAREETEQRAAVALNQVLSLCWAWAHLLAFAE